MRDLMAMIYCSVVLLLIICVGSLSAQPRIFLTVRPGSSVVLPCDWRNVSSQRPHVEWRTISETVFERQGEECYQGKGYQNRVDVPQDKLSSGNCSLLLKRVQLEDAGIYESYLLVRRRKRSLSTKRVFLQSVELSVEDFPEEGSYEERSAVKDGAEMNSVRPLVLGFIFLCLLCWNF